MTVVALTTTRQLVGLPGNVAVPADTPGVSADSVVNVTQIATVDRLAPEEHLGTFPDWLVAQIDAGIVRALGLTPR